MCRAQDFEANQVLGRTAGEFPISRLDNYAPLPFAVISLPIVTCESFTPRAATVALILRCNSLATECYGVSQEIVDFRTRNAVIDNQLQLANPHLLKPSEGATMSQPSSSQLPSLDERVRVLEIRMAVGIGIAVLIGLAGVGIGGLAFSAYDRVQSVRVQAAEVGAGVAPVKPDTGLVANGIG